MTASRRPRLGVEAFEDRVLPSGYGPSPHRGPGPGGPAVMRDADDGLRFPDSQHSGPGPSAPDAGPGHWPPSGLRVEPVPSHAARDDHAGKVVYTATVV